MVFKNNFCDKYLVCIASAFCFLISSQIAFAAEFLVLPKPTGHYSVGTRSIEVIDKTRTNLRDQKNKKWMIQGVSVLSHAKINADPIVDQKKFNEYCTYIMNWLKHISD